MTWKPRSNTWKEKVQKRSTETKHCHAWSILACIWRLRLPSQKSDSVVLICFYHFLSFLSVSCNSEATVSDTFAEVISHLGLIKGKDTTVTTFYLSQWNDAFIVFTSDPRSTHRRRTPSSITSTSFSSSGSSTITSSTTTATSITSTMTSYTSTTYTSSTITVTYLEGFDYISGEA